MKYAFPRLEDASFWDRCSRRTGLLLLLLFLFSAGVFSGPLLSLGFSLFTGDQIVPLFFSGILAEGMGFLSCFYTLLLNLLFFLTVSFSLGAAIFGPFAIPVLVFCKGLTVGLGVSSFLWTDGLSGWGKAALTYTPAAALSALVFLLFSLRALAFSDRIRKVGLSGEPLDFRSYWKDYLQSLCCAVAVSILGAAAVFLCLVIFSLVR